MTALFDCPGIDRWPTLLDDTLTPEQWQAFERHLETCPHCQERIDQKQEYQERVGRLGRQFGDPTQKPTDPVLSQILERLYEVKSPLSSVPAGPADLSFLHPSDRPELLGTLGNYEVQELVGQGGMGIVLRAFEPALHRVVAVKVLSPFLGSSATARLRFTREAKAAAAVCHEHVVTVHGVHEADGLPYLVMQYVAGESLQARLDRSGPLEVVEIVRIGMQTAAGLAAAHAQGLIHRDIKPANLLLENGLARVKITDFGLARMVDDVGLTQNGVLAGTPEYMAPEQARGEAVDHRSDLFSLGSVLYACCTGVPPFRATSTVAVLRKVSDEEPAPIRSLEPDVPAWLETLIGRLMAKDPAQRFGSAAEVAALLESYLAHLREPRSVPAPALKALPPTPRPAAGLPSLVLLGWVGLVVFGMAALLFGLARSARQMEKQALVPTPPAENVEVWSVAVSSDGQIVAGSAGRWDQPGEIGVWNLATQEPLQRFSEDLGVASIALSPDGKLLASGSWSGHVRVFDWARGKQLFDFPVQDVARVAFSPDGQLLATATEDKVLQLWDLTTGKLLADLAGDLVRFHCVTFSPDGQRLLAGGGDWKAKGINQVGVWDVASKKQVLKLTGHQNAVLGISFSPDAKTIATAAADRTVRLWDAADGRLLKTLAGHTHWVESVAFSADGKTLVSGSPDSTIRFWDVEKGRETSRITMPGLVRAVRFTPAGDALLAGGGRKTLKVFAASDHKELAALWNGSELRMVAMDHLPFATLHKARDRGWLVALGLVGVGLGFLGSLSFAVRLSLRRHPAEPLPEAAAPARFSFPCGACGIQLKGKAALAGKTFQCPKCRKPTVVPSPRPESAPRVRRRFVQRDVLAAFAVSAMLAILFLASLWLSRTPPEPHVSKLQVLADRVKTQKIDAIDARPYPSVGDRDLVVLEGLSNLRTLNLDHTATSDEGLKSVARARNLVALSLTNTQVSDTGLGEIGTLTGLEDLRLDRLPITDAGLAHLRALPRLKKLSLFKTLITDRGLVDLKELPSLERLSLDDTQVGDEGLRHLSQCPNLKYLSVWHTQVTPAGIEELRKALPGLKVNR